MAPEQSQVDKSASKEKPSTGVGVQKNNNVNENVPPTPRVPRKRTNTGPNFTTPKKRLVQQAKQTIPTPRSSSKKPLCNVKPKAAHSGVPIPKRMKKLFQKQLIGLNDSL